MMPRPNGKAMNKILRAKLFRPVERHRQWRQQYPVGLINAV
jgi:hypothetical protein